jgi:hypothetical protein
MKRPGSTTNATENDGPGGGSNADFFDGQHASCFMVAATENWERRRGQSLFTPCAAMVYADVAKQLEVDRWIKVQS